MNKNSIFETIANTPIPAILILFGLFFIYLGFFDRFFGMKISEKMKKYAFPTGVSTLLIGCFFAVYDPPGINTNYEKAQENKSSTVIAAIDNYFENIKNDRFDKSWDMLKRAKWREDFSSTRNFWRQNEGFRYYIIDVSEGKNKSFVSMNIELPSTDKTVNVTYSLKRILMDDLKEFNYWSFHERFYKN